VCRAALLRGAGLRQPTSAYGAGRAGVWKCVVVCVFVICTSAVVIYGVVVGYNNPRLLLVRGVLVSGSVWSCACLLYVLLLW